MILQIIIVACTAYLVILTCLSRVGQSRRSEIPLNENHPYVKRQGDFPLCVDQLIDATEIDQWTKENYLTRSGSPDLSNELSEIINGVELYLSPQPIFRAAHTVSFSFFERQDISIHYMINDPRDRLCPHPAIRELYFLNLFRGRNVSPDPIGISRALSPYTAGVKTSFSRQAMQSAAVGYVLMGIHDQTLYEYFKEYSRDFHSKTYGLKNSIMLGIELLEIVQTVHSRQIVHGRISMHSFVSVEPTGGACSFRLINWRHAYRVTTRDDSLFVPVDVPQTPWEFLGIRPSFRDDVFGIFVIMSTLISGFDCMKILTFDRMKHGDIFCQQNLRATNIYNRLTNVLNQYVGRAERGAHIDILGIVDELRNIVKTL